MANRKVVRAGLAALLLAAPLAAAAGEVVLPSDISTTLTVTPRTGLRPGQPIELTISVTNHGPEPVSRVLVTGPDIHDEFELYLGNNCPMFATIVDRVDGWYWIPFWYPAFPYRPDMAVGETRTCQVRMRLSAVAPAVVPLSFGLPDFYSDTNAANDRDTVFLARAVDGVDATAAVPALEPAALLLLITMLTAAAGLRLRAARRTRASR